MRGQEPVIRACIFSSIRRVGGFPMRSTLAVLCLLVLAACAKDVPVNIDLTDEQVAALSKNRSGTLAIHVDEAFELFNPAPALNCQGLPILVWNSEVTDRINRVLESGEYPLGFGRMVQQYPEVARVMTCADGSDSVWASVDILTAERVAPGDYTLYVLASIVTGAGACSIWQIPVTVLPSEKTNLVYSKDLQAASVHYTFAYRLCK